MTWVIGSHSRKAELELESEGKCCQCLSTASIRQHPPTTSRQPWLPRHRLAKQQDQHPRSRFAPSISACIPSPIIFRLFGNRHHYTFHVLCSSPPCL
ncbi:hypothetical protein BCR44DRAFT_1435559, partial [Catenaria anguillulae PL171]